MLKVLEKNFCVYSGLCTKSTLHKLLCKPKDRVATEVKNNIVYETDCSNCESVYVSESKQCLKLCSDEHKRPARSCDCEKNEIGKAFHWKGWHYNKKPDQCMFHYQSYLIFNHRSATLTFNGSVAIFVIKNLISSCYTSKAVPP